MPFTYSDESHYGPNGEFCGVGLLISQDEISIEVVESAIEKLRNDPDRTRRDRKDKDERTLKRGNFHASEDSANGHSHLCDAINTLATGEFACDFFDGRKFAPRTSLQSFIYEQATTMAALHLSARDSVTMTFAERSGLSLETLRLWHRKHERTLAESVYQLPFEPTVFPRCHFKIVSMKEPGLQIADFILWAHVRNANDDPIWLSRIRAVNKTVGRDVASAYHGHLVLGSWVQSGSPPYGHLDMPTNPDEVMTENDALNFFVIAVRLVISLHKNGCPPHVIHLKSEIDHIAERAKSARAPGVVEDIAFMYIRLADTLPLINASSTLLEKQKFLLTKRLMSLVLRGDLINGMSTRHWLERGRLQILERQPELFQV
jgi:hypothetical protein